MADAPAVGIRIVGVERNFKLVSTESARKGSGLMEIAGTKDSKDMLFCESIIDDDASDEAYAGEADAGGKERRSREFHGRVDKVGFGGERGFALPAKEFRKESLSLTEICRTVLYIPTEQIRSSKKVGERPENGEELPTFGGELERRIINAIKLNSKS